MRLVARFSYVERSRSIALALGALALAPTLAGLALDPASADSVRDLAAPLPRALTYHAAAWANGNAYVFGGTTPASGMQSYVIRYDPAANEHTILPPRLPTPLASPSAVTVGTQIYIFGGFDNNGQARREILRFDPQTETLTTMGAQLPVGLAESDAAWDGRYVWLAGGRDGSGPRREVLRYDPAADSIATLSGQLPTARRQVSVVALGDHVYVLGGYGPSNERYDEVLRVDKTTGAVSTMSYFLPVNKARVSMKAATSGDVAYLIGGSECNGGSSMFCKDILRFTPSAAGPKIVSMSTSLPYVLVNHAVAWDGARAFVFAGFTSGGSVDKTLVYTLEPGAVSGVSAVAGPAGGQFSLSWTAPSSTSYGGSLQSYDVYAGNASGSLSLLASVPATSTSFVESGLGNGATRYYKVRAVGSAGAGPLSAEAFATTASPPGPPTGLAAAPGARKITLAWSLPAENGGAPLTAIEIHRGASSGAVTLHATTSGGATSWTDEGLGEGETFRYVVKAVNLAGASEASNEASARTFTRPGAPRNLTWDPAGADPLGIALAWEAPADDGGTPVTRYRVWRGTSEGDLAVVRETTDTRFVDEPGALGLWVYRVSAANAVGEGPQSNTERAVGGATPVPVPEL